jgi:MYXO-CTERM domain-containing protein
VPEPGTWAAAGLLVAAAVLRRALRRKQATP